MDGPLKDSLPSSTEIFDNISGLLGLEGNLFWKQSRNCFARSVLRTLIMLLKGYVIWSLDNYYLSVCLDIMCCAVMTLNGQNIVLTDFIGPKLK